MDLLNYVIYDCICDYEINKVEELIFQEKLCSIVLSNQVSFKTREYKKKYSFDECFKIAYDFLSTISKEYASHLIKRRDENAFIVDVNKAPLYPYSFSNIIDGIPKMYINFNNNIGCSYSIMHEFIHDMTIMGSENSITRTIFCEVMTLYAEKLMDKFLKENNYKDYYIHARNIANAINEKALHVSFELELIKCFLSRGYITNSDIKVIMKKFNYNNDLSYHYVDIILDQQLSWPSEQRYLIGYLLASHMMEREQQKSTGSKEFLELNDKINIFNENQFLNYLDLEKTNNSDIFSLTDDSYELLKINYIKQLKKIR